MASYTEHEKQQDVTFHTLPYPDNSRNEPRTIGFELEFAAIPIKDCAQIIAELFDGKVEAQSSMIYNVTGTESGDFRIELDAKFAQNIARRLEKEPEETEDSQSYSLGPGMEFRKRLSQFLQRTAAEVIPLEIVTPPLDFSTLPTLETLRQKLYEAHAEGTRAGFFYGFGMHINPEIYSTDTTEIMNILRAFILLYPWLRDRMEIDLSRRITSFIDPFPIRYARKITHPDYQPDLHQMMRDYVEDNPTRNRALDMLPLFAWLDKDYLKKLPLPEHEKLNARPTFHYRLPNCELDDADWRIARDWNYWVEIEKLAIDKKKLHGMMQDFQTYWNERFIPHQGEWVKQLCDDYGYQTPQN